MIVRVKGNSNIYLIVTVFFNKPALVTISERLAFSCNLYRVHGIKTIILNVKKWNVLFVGNFSVTLITG